jgi:hypothetical protein
MVISISPILDEQHRSTRPSSIHRHRASHAAVRHGCHPVVDSTTRATATPSPSTPSSSDSSTNATAAGKLLSPLVDPPSQSAPFPMALSRRTTSAGMGQAGRIHRWGKPAHRGRGPQCDPALCTNFYSFHFRWYFQKLLQPSKISRKWNTTPKNIKSILDESSRT